MLYYNRTDVFKSIDINKTSGWKECIIYHFLYFLDKGFKFKPFVSNGCHNVLMMFYKP